MPDYYNVLGIHKTADDKTIRQAYRRLARKYHPDVNPGDSSAEESLRMAMKHTAYSPIQMTDASTTDMGSSGKIGLNTMNNIFQTSIRDPDSVLTHGPCLVGPITEPALLFENIPTQNQNL